MMVVFMTPPRQSRRGLSSFSALRSSSFELKEEANRPWTGKHRYRLLVLIYSKAAEAERRFFYYMQWAKSIWDRGDVLLLYCITDAHEEGVQVSLLDYEQRHRQYLLFSTTYIKEFPQVKGLFARRAKWETAAG